MRKRIPFTAAVLAALILIFVLWAKHAPETKNTVSDPSPRSQVSHNRSRIIPDQESSGPADKFPWDNDPAFKAAQRSSGAGMLLGGYRTVLHDPLPGEEENVHLAARLLSGKSVAPGEVFSQNQAIGPYTEDRGFSKGPTYIGNWLTTTVGGGVCKIASTLYNVSVLADLPVIERHCHSMPVPYVPYGQDATVAYGVKDFRFQNCYPYPVLIWAEGRDNVLYMAIYGQSVPPRVEWHHKVLKETKASRIYRSNLNLPPGTEKIVSEGMNGALIQSWVTVYYGQKREIRMMTSSYYAPLPTIIEKGTP